MSAFNFKPFRNGRLRKVKLEIQNNFIFNSKNMAMKYDFHVFQ